MCGAKPSSTAETPATPETVADPSGPNLFADLSSVFSPKIGRSPDFEAPDAVTTIANDTK